MRTNNTIAGMIFITIAVVMMTLTLWFPPFPGQKFGPSLFPRLLGVGMIICGVLLLMRGRHETQPAFQLAGWMREPWRRVSYLLVIALPLLAIFTWDKIGFVPVTLVSMLALFLWFRVRPATAVLTAIIGTALLQIFFGKLMRVPLPLGWLLNLPPHWLKYIT